MESNSTGAENDDRLKRLAEEKEAKFEKIRKAISAANAQPLNYEEFLRKAREIAERNKKRGDEWRKGQGDDDITSQ